MTPTWDSATKPIPPSLTFAAKLRAIGRGIPLAILVFGGLVILLLVRLIERPVFKHHRPWTPFITVFVCRNALRFLGLKLHVKGSSMQRPGSIVANHSSWLDIFALNATGPLYFVSKAEVAGWMGIGRLAKATGTVFVRRSRKEAADQKKTFETRLRQGHRLLFFPEGTSTDGQRVLAFKPTLFAAHFSDGLEDLSVQPVTVVYNAPKGQDPRTYAWWGDMEFAPHLLQVLAMSPQGSIDVIWHAPISVAEVRTRKSLAALCEKVVRSAHPQGDL